MADTLYKASDVDPIVQDLMGQVASALEVAKSATERAERAEAQEVILQKVASIPKYTGLNGAKVDDFLTKLADLALIKPEGIEKIAADLTQDPNNVLEFALDVLKISAGSHDEGSGIPKNASVLVPSESGDPDGWTNVTSNGA